MNTPYALDVVLATYNGEKYIAQQLDSLLNQTYTDFSVLIRDDGSSDNTLAIVREYADKHPDRITLINSGEISGNASKNFGVLLEKSKAKYVMCCDQDDIWLPDKVKYFMKMITFYEGVYGRSKPILFHADLKVVSENLEPLNDSLWEYQNLKILWGQDFNRLLSQNIVTGCSSIMNRALLDVALPIPYGAVMHDWWLALVANAFGILVSDRQALMLYRQHSKNVVGAKKYNSDSIWVLINKLFERREIGKNLILGSEQAKDFYIRYPLHPKADVARDFASLPTMSWLSKRIIVIRRRFWKMGFLRNVSWLIRM
ncbi:glycosyltransferase family 2 protein [Deinococcus oregonensis]|uniref:Glycosyltransferase family 2 protein n=1 Tax=Deinococcus oregonensis TaxID=1805970 RepID=A0ABV6BAC3_9DEIO